MSDDDDPSLDGADVVDFDALHAALGELPSPGGASSPVVAESQGLSNAAYASARPHAIPKGHALVDDPNAPAVIVQTEDTVPTGPPPMTLPMGMPPGPPVAASSGSHRAGVPVASAASPAHPFPPQPFAAQPPRQPPLGNIQSTMRMPPANPPRRRPRAMTIVVRPRGPNKTQKLLVFVSMLLVFVGGGIAALVYYRPGWLNLAPKTPPPQATRALTGAMTGAAPATATASPTVIPSAIVAPPVTPSASASALPSASAKKPRRLLP